MDLGDCVDLLTQLRRRVDDVETVVASLRLSDVRVSVSANSRREVTDGGVRVRPRILPAFKFSSSVRHSLHSVPSSASSGITAYDV